LVVGVLPPPCLALFAAQVPGPGGSQWQFEEEIGWLGQRRDDDAVDILADAGSGNSFTEVPMCSAQSVEVCASDPVRDLEDPGGYQDTQGGPGHEEPFDKDHSGKSLY
jgi:hypothetical protein